MDSEPITLADWYKILDVADFEEAATLANDGDTPPPWAAIFLRNWAPDLINARKRWQQAGKRKDVLDQLAIVEAAGQQLVEVLENPEVMKFLQLPPFPPFESELGTRVFVGGLVARACHAMDSPNLSTGDGEGRVGAGRAIPPKDPDPKVFCAAIVSELWKKLHGAYPTAADNAMEAATSYWKASRGTFPRGWGDSRSDSWPPYFRRINDELLSGWRIEMRRQLES